MRYWTEISFSTLYYELKKLQQKDLVTSETQLSKNNVAKKVFTVNSKGRRIMKEMVYELISHIEKIVWQIDLGMANICLLDDVDTIEAFEKYINSIDKSIKIYEELLNFLKTNNYPDSDCALAERPIMHLEVEKKWAEEYLIGVKNGTKTNWKNKNSK
jgi:DNA-binding PadR family transcriptional regulator